MIIILVVGTTIHSYAQYYCLLTLTSYMFSADIPLDIIIRETSDAGTPITIAEPQSSQVRFFNKKNYNIRTIYMSDY